MKLSVIIATYNDEEYLEDLLKILTYQEVDEVVIADKGSTDGTVGIARQYGADICRAPYSSLGDLWNAGFNLCANEISWFLRANCKIPFDAASLILDEMELGDKSLIGGYFKNQKADKNLLGKAGNTLTSLFKSEKISSYGLFLLTSVVYSLQGFPDSSTPVADIAENITKHGKLVKIPRTIELFSENDTN
ncbi:MAG: glycosyltransferase family 2 protein [Planctomycetota bacterium]|jgi:glycosyltransferase involved in cell wall biosynthesis